MDISLEKLELQTFIREKVASGAYRSAEEVVEAGLTRLMLDPVVEALTTEDLEAIAESEQQFAKGEGVDFDTAAKALRARYSKS